MRTRIGVCAGSVRGTVKVIMRASVFGIGIRSCMGMIIANVLLRWLCV